MATQLTASGPWWIPSGLRLVIVLSGVISGMLLFSGSADGGQFLIATVPPLIYVAVAAYVALHRPLDVRLWPLWVIGDVVMVSYMSYWLWPFLALLAPLPVVTLHAGRAGVGGGILAALLSGLGAVLIHNLGPGLGVPVSWTVFALWMGTALLVGGLVGLERSARLRAQSMAVTDDLTGLYNQRYFYTRGPEELARARRYETDLSLLVADLDEFKAINDRLGHLQGDLAIRQVAMIITDCLRETDMVFRYGGEEFVMMLPETGVHAAREVAERIRTTVDTHQFLSQGGAVMDMSVSIGVAQWLGEDSIVDVLRRADGAMYGAKSAGKNRVEVSWFRSHLGENGEPVQYTIDMSGEEC